MSAAAEDEWPELFALLSEAERRAVLETLRGTKLPGSVLYRSDVVDAIKVTCGVIDQAEYDRRAQLAESRDRVHKFLG